MANRHRVLNQKPVRIVSGGTGKGIALSSMAGESPLRRCHYERSYERLRKPALLF
jgi:hypothetical protein